jgi:hypothetical protein
MAFDFGDYGGEQPSGWDASATRQTLDTPSWQMPENAGGGWQGFGKLGQDLLTRTLPSVLGAAAGYGFGSLMPGKTSLVDQRNPQQQQGQQMGLQAGQMNLDRMNNLTANPLSFGLPGDPNDPNTPAGKKRYDIIQSSRGADAARGMFSTGGSAQRETNALNNAVGNEYNNIFQHSTQGATQGGQVATSGPGMHYVEKSNPWAQLFGGIASPAVSGLTQGILRNFGLTANG